MPPKRSVRIESKNKRKLKEEVMEEVSSAAVTQQQITTPVNFFPVQSHLQQLQPSAFSVKSQQRPTVPDNVDKCMTRPFSNFTALLTEEDDPVTGPLKLMYDHIDLVTKAHSGQVRNMLLDVYRRHYNSLSIVANNEAAKKLVEKEEELRQAKVKIMELEMKVNQLTHQGQKMQIKVTNLEVRCAVLDSRLYAAVRSEAQQKQESVESSYVHPHVVEPSSPSFGICRVCFKAKAASTMWPCRHFCVCAPCAATVTACPICQTPNSTANMS